MNRAASHPEPTPGGRNRTNLYLTVGILVAALAALTVVILANRTPESGTAAAPEPGTTAAPASGTPATSTVESPARSAEAVGHTLSVGPKGSPELVEFIDFQCEACHAFYGNITQRLVEDYDGRITFSIRLFPLPGHPLGMPAALAAEAAALQGKFAEFYTILFSEYDSWAGHRHGASPDDLAEGTAYFRDVAERIGLDLEKFDADSNSPAVLEVVEESVAAGIALGVTSTPTFFLDGEKFGESATSYGDFDQQLRAALDEALGE